MTRIWEEVVEEGIVTEKSSRATELIIVLIILAIIAFAVGCLFNLASPSSEASSCSLGTGFIDTLSSMNQSYTIPVGAGIHKRRPALTFTITAYCPKSCCCGEFADGITASGHIIEPNDCFVAAPPDIPFGTRLSIPGYADGRMVPVLDRGGKIKGNRFDVFIPDHNDALAWGVQEMRIEQ